MTIERRVYRPGQCFGTETLHLLIANTDGLQVEKVKSIKGPSSTSRVVTVNQLTA